MFKKDECPYKVGDVVISINGVTSESDSVYTQVGYIIKIQKGMHPTTKKLIRQYVVSTSRQSKSGYVMYDWEIEPSLPELVGLYLEERRYPQPETLFSVPVQRGH